MSQQVFFEDVAEGQDLPQLVKNPSTRQLVKWAGASGDYYEIHYDKDFAQSTGLDGCIVHGWLTFSFVAQMVTDWMGQEAFLKKVGVSYRGMNVPGQDIICKGTVTKKYEAEGEKIVECDIRAETSEGKKTTPGKVVVALPSRQ
jgi:acyl dehydratase